ncbi:MAG TPA: 2-oxo-4-hydroxy-4-carboxy-5-ureidoimidazoline decarboxylase [Thermoanaerobaculia bacterium]|nr:2-oxo-4-hydroxy-4-carboxy-5-ureidoimidazoline decarboxylase [Thermoanaerobaculia bacterium]
MTGNVALRRLLARCCAARRWIDAMASSAPWAGAQDLLAASESAFGHLERGDWLEAFAGHPRIGDLEALRSHFAPAKRAGRPAAQPSTEADSGGEDGSAERGAIELAGREQAATASAPEAVLRALAEGNARYDARFGHLFVVFASGKSAEQMLELLEQRLGNEPEQELRIAAEEQRKITRRRLSELAEEILAAAGANGGEEAS